MKDPAWLILLGVAGILCFLAIMAYTLWYERWRKPACWSCGQEHPESQMQEMSDSRYRRGRLVCAKCRHLLI